MHKSQMKYMFYYSSVNKLLSSALCCILRIWRDVGFIASNKWFMRKSVLY